MRFGGVRFRDEGIGGWGSPGLGALGCWVCRGRRVPRFWGCKVRDLGCHLGGAKAVPRLQRQHGRVDGPQGHSGRGPRGHRHRQGGLGTQVGPWRGHHYPYLPQPHNSSVNQYGHWQLPVLPVPPSNSQCVPIAPVLLVHCSCYQCSQCSQLFPVAPVLLLPQQLLIPLLPLLCSQYAPVPPAAPSSSP